MISKWFVFLDTNPVLMFAFHEPHPLKPVANFFLFHQFLIDGERKMLALKLWHGLRC